MSDELLSHHFPKEGDLYNELLIRGKRFRLAYGYYEEFERESRYNEPMPIYPDFVKNPLCTEEGVPFVTAMQDVCRHYQGKEEEDSCSGCIFFEKSEDLFGFCNYPENQVEQPDTTVADD